MTGYDRTGPDGPPPVMDWLDLKQRLGHTEEALNAERLAHRKLEALALGLVYYVPDHVTLADVRATQERLLALMDRADALERENAALRGLPPHPHPITEERTVSGHE